MGHKIILNKRFVADIRAGKLAILIRCRPSALVSVGCVLDVIGGDGMAIRVPKGLGDMRNGVRILSMRRISIGAVSGAANRKHTKYEFSVCVETAGGEMHELDGKAYYIRLLDEARAFLDSQYDGAILSATTGELSPLLQRAGVDDEMCATVVELFQFGDLVKFAYRTVTLEDRTRHLDDFRRLAQTVYRQREERHHVGV